MRLKIDTNTTTFLAAGDAEPLTERDTDKPRLDRDGQPLFVVRVVALSDGEAEVIPVRVAGAAPKGVTQGTAVRVVGLTATPWSMNDRDGTRAGLTFRAERIEPVPAARQAG